MPRNKEGSLVQRSQTCRKLRGKAENPGRVARGIATGRTKAADLAASYYERIEKKNPRLNAYLSLTKERALEQAAKRGCAWPPRATHWSPLAGIPVGIKDVLVMKGAPATAGSKILQGYRPPYDATAVAKLEAAGAVLLGKLNCDEFAMGSSTENSAYGPVRNPVDTERVPGGSSGGSAAAVAANLAVATLGSDTGGSIRQPASFCGVVGVLPTYGRVSRYGLIAYASSLDRVGPFAANVRDAATLLSVIAGHDPLDATSSPAPVPDYAAESDKPVAGSAHRRSGGVLCRGPRPGGARGHRKGHCRAEGRRLRHQAGLAAEYPLRHSRLLPDRHGRGQRQSGPL
jgi:aspartyl-tRNA(Asn)/glutamyl-tRNA(Gln) amidotransferase subunit A